MNLSSIVQQLQAEQQHQALARPAATLSSQSADSTAGSSGANSNSTTGEATITADDFLQLLVSELQNQDPTADTDPNEYVNQLVNVNSLQQLISINQEVGDMTPPTGSGASSSSVVNALAAAAPGASTSLTPAQTTSAGAGSAALQPQAGSGAQSAATSPLVPASAGGVFDDLASKLANSAIPAAWHPKSTAVH